MKIHCPFHDDSTPSMEVYPNGRGWCFVCNKGADLNTVEGIEVPEVQPKEPEDVEATVEYIRALPMKRIRGLDFHANERGYFILWPNNDYYKFRSFKGEPRYLAPTGHNQPFFIPVRLSNAKLLAIVEGEINALSLATSAADLGIDVLSPGPSGNFTSYVKDILQIASNYERILIWTDQDSAGIKALWAIAPKLLRKDYRVSFLNTESDANDILINEGHAGIRAVLETFSEGITNE